MLTTFAENHAKRMCPNIDDVLLRFEIERQVLDVFDEIRDREYMIYEDYLKLIYLNIHFIDMLCSYKNIEDIVARELILQECVTYDNFVSILQNSMQYLRVVVYVADDLKCIYLGKRKSRPIRRLEYVRAFPMI